MFFMSYTTLITANNMPVINIMQMISLNLFFIAGLTWKIKKLTV